MISISSRSIFPAPAPPCPADFDPFPAPTRTVGKGGFPAPARPIDFWPSPSLPREKNSFPVHPWSLSLWTVPALPDHQIDGIMWKYKFSLSLIDDQCVNRWNTHYHFIVTRTPQVPIQYFRLDTRLRLVQQCLCCSVILEIENLISRMGYEFICYVHTRPERW